MNAQWQIASFEQLSNNDLYELLRLRQEVFVVEQACLYNDMDRLDQNCVHMLHWNEDRQLQGYLRCLPPGLHYPQSAIGRVVTSPSARSRDLGRELVRRGIEHNVARWPESAIRLNAQAYLRKFYAEFGFVTQGDEYDEYGIPHVQMLLDPPA